MMRKTKIVATVGVACEKETVLKSMMMAGADVLRINASHTSQQRLAEWILFIRRSASSLKKTIGILVDLQGPRVRTGPLERNKPLLLRKGAEVRIVISTHPSRETTITTSCIEFPQMVKKGDAILLDNGLLELRVAAVEKSGVRCRVMRGGDLGANKGVNLPHAPTVLPALTKKDLADLKVATAHDVDYIALSFVRSESDVHVLKKWLSRRGKEIPVIAKIEKPSAIQRMKSILEISDGIMVARGDLGIEMGVEKVPSVQKTLIEQAHRAHVPVITATEMLETMIEKIRPTRAEVSDVANAVFDGTDAVMLSGETAVGKYPVQAIRMMSIIIREAEHHLKNPDTGTLHHRDRTISPVHAITLAALKAAENLQAKAIVIFTRSSKTALLVSLLKPACSIIALSSTKKIQNRMALFRGVIPLNMRHSASTDKMIEEANRVILRSGLLKQGDPVVLVSGRQALPGARYMAKIHLIGEHLAARH